MPVSIGENDLNKSTDYNCLDKDLILDSVFKRNRVRLSTENNKCLCLFMEYSLKEWVLTKKFFLIFFNKIDQFLLIESTNFEKKFFVFYFDYQIKLFYSINFFSLYH